MISGGRFYYQIFVAHRKEEGALGLELAKDGPLVREEISGDALLLE